MNILYPYIAVVVVNLLTVHPAIGVNYQENHLEIEKSDKYEIVGCYGQTESKTAGICFVIRNDYICISTKDGGLLSQYWKLGEDVHFMRAMDRVFFRYMYMAFEILQPNSVCNLIKILDFKQFISGFFGITSKPAKDHRHMCDTRADINEIARLLAETSNVLQTSLKLPQSAKMLVNFHLLSLSLVKAYEHSHQGLRVRQDPSLLDKNSSGKPARGNDCVTAVPDNLESSEDDMIIAGSQIVVNATNDECFGMCGPHCWCWRWVCGDCCLHHGCHQHDLCCKHSYLSTHCLFPWVFGFSCRDGYLGYPECLHQ